MSRFPEDHHTSTVEGAAAWERARGEADDYGLDEIGYDRYAEAGDELAHDRAVPEDQEESNDAEEEA